MSATFGRSSLRQFAYYDPDSSCWRTWPAISLWGPETYSATLPKRGSMRSGALYEHPTWALVTADSGCSSLLPTPTAWEQGNDSKFLERREALKAKGYNGNGAGMPLDVAVRFLPTPAAADGERGPDYARMNRETSGGDDLVTTMARLLPTPNASDFRGSTSPESAKDWAQRGVNLPERIQRLRRLPTPTARDHKGQNQRRDNSCLPGAITGLPSIDTPASLDDDRLPLWTSEDASRPDSWSG